MSGSEGKKVVILYTVCKHLISALQWLYIHVILFYKEKPHCLSMIKFYKSFFCHLRNWCWQIISLPHYPEALDTWPTWPIWVWERTCCNTFLRRLVSTTWSLYALCCTFCSPCYFTLQQCHSVIIENQNFHLPFIVNQLDSVSSQQGKI